MAEFDIHSLPSNSYNYSDSSDKKEEKNVKKIVEGKVIVKKKSGIQKFANAMFAEDIKMIKSYILWDVLLPMVKDGISDIIKNTVDLALYGRTSKGRDSRSGFVNYSGISTSKVSYASDSKKQRPAAKNMIEDTIIFADKREAEMVLDTLRDYLDKYGQASVADLYALTGTECAFTANNYGWKNLKDAKIIRIRDGYLLEMPRIVELD